VRHEVVLAMGLVGLYLVVYLTLAILRHRTYHSYGFDLALFDQAFWNTTQGRPFESTISQANPSPHSYFGDHFSPVYWLVFPFYLAYPHPETLLVIQTVLISLGAVPVYLLAQLKLEPGLQRAGWVAAYFLFLPVAYVTLFDFHDVTLSILPLGLALYFLERGRLRWFLACLGFALLIKEEMGLIVFGFGAYVLLGKRKVPLGLALMGGGIACFLALVELVIPHFAGGTSYPYLADRYSALGRTPLEILETVITNPARLGGVLLQAKKAEFVAGIFGPLLFLPLFSRWAAILLLPTLGYLLLSSYQPEYSFATQYSAPLIALVLGCSILALSRLPSRWQGRVTTAVLVSSLGFSILFGDLPFSRHFDLGTFTPEPRYAAFSAVLRLIPASASVASQDGLTAQLAERRRIYAIGYEGIEGADFVLLDYAAEHGNVAAHQALLAEVEAQGYDLVGSGSGLALLEKRP
jgi:uncharacterized membrane protein